MNGDEMDFMHLMFEDVYLELIYLNFFSFSFVLLSIFGFLIP